MRFTILQLALLRYGHDDNEKLVLQEGLGVEKRSGSQAKWWKQLSILTQRSFLNMSRDMGYYWVRIIVYILLSLCVGTIFYDLGTNYTSIFARGACAGFISGFMTFMSIGGFPSFLEEMKVKVISKGDFLIEK